MKRTILLLIVAFVCFLLSNGQSVNKDYLDFNFKYINCKYEISIDSKTFDSIVVKNNFSHEKITNYKDSLAVVLIGELNDWSEFYKAFAQLNFTWQRISYYCWLPVSEVRSISNKLEFNHPYRFYRSMMNDANKHPLIIDIVDRIKTKLKLINTDIRIDSLNRKQFFMIALKYNPDRIQDEQKLKLTQAYITKHSSIDSTKIGVGCEKKDCCQKDTVFLNKSVYKEEKSFY